MCACACMYVCVQLALSPGSLIFSSYAVCSIEKLGVGPGNEATCMYIALKARQLSGSAVFTVQIHIGLHWLAPLGQGLVLEAGIPPEGNPNRVLNNIIIIQLNCSLKLHPPLCCSFN